MKIYLDLLIVQDVLILYLILNIVNQLMQLKISRKRILLVALIDTFVEVLAIILIKQKVISLLIRLIVSLLTIEIGFKIKSKDIPFEKIIMCFLITAMFGGIAKGLRLNGIMMIILFLLVNVFISMYCKKFNRRKLISSITCYIEFDFEGETYSLKALVDTGHSVKTIYNEDVIFINANILKVKEVKCLKKRIVSYQTVSGKTQVEGIKVKNINVIYDNSSKYKNAVIVSNTNIKKEFEAIVSWNLVL